jgi:flagellin-specific chaperone FliS
LCGTLNRDAGDLTEKLSALYAFLVEQITVANARRDVKVAEDCIEILTTLKEGWAGIVEHEMTPKPSETTALPVGEPAPAPSGGVSVQA